MVIYFSALAIITVSLVVFYFRARKSSNNVIRYVEYGLSAQDKQRYIESAERCKKENSPVSDEPFHKLFLEGSDIVNSESFKIRIVTDFGSCGEYVL